MDTRSPIATDLHSFARIAERLVFEASAAPAIPEISAWLSLVGMPKKQAADAQAITDINAQHNEISAARGSLPKSAIPYSVSATLGRIIAIMIAPAKLQSAASKREFLGVSERVHTQPAIALGASVQPFTIATAIIRTVKKVCIFLPPTTAILIIMKTAAVS